MPVSLENIRDELLPGLWAMNGRYSAIPSQWDKIFGLQASFPIAAPEVAPFMIGPGAIVALGVAAAIVKNHDVSRRGIFAFWDHLTGRG